MIERKPLQQLDNNQMHQMQPQQPQPTFTGQCMPAGPSQVRIEEVEYRNIPINNSALPLMLIVTVIIILRLSIYSTREIWRGNVKTSCAYRIYLTRIILSPAN